jgi:pimeloyl-ACP methyl ester carboxylesterase
VFNLAYASTRGDVGQHAAALDRVIQRLDGIEEINFVAHSLGNLVIRHYFRDQTASGRGPDVRIKRIVMLGPPNQGAQLAKRMGRNGLFEFFAGASGQQLAAKWDELQSKLAIPTCEFGIIAGGIGTTNGRNPLIQGDDDFVVRVDETRLAGARDFAVLPVIHTIMMNDPKVMEYTARFLEHGYFISEDERQPITHDADEGGAQE